jgi:hypothetical protein
MIHSTKDAGPELRRYLYNAAMKVLERKIGPTCWDLGWPLIRGEGKKILRNDRASDSECAEALILHLNGQAV